MTWVPPDGPPSVPPTRPVGEPPVAHPSDEPPPSNDTTPSPRRRSSWLPAVLGVAALLACIVVFVVASDGSSDRSADAPDTAAADDPAEGEAERIRAEVAELSGFVAETRGLEFLTEVEVELLADDDFRDRLLEEVEDDADELAATNEVLQALQLLADDDDLREILPEFLGDAVVGFYDPENGELVVRGSDVTPYVRSTLVHELTHALDDQHFELDRPQLDEAVDESATAFSALVEGSAVRVEEEWFDQLARDEQRALRAEELQLGATIDVDDVPPVVRQIVGFPYAYGPSFVGALLDDGGQERLDAAFDEPPTTTAEILDPERYLAGRDALDVVTPAADGEVVEEGVFGQWALLLTLSEKVPEAVALEAGRGWVGDRYVAWTDGGETCVRTTFRMVTTADAALLAGALEDWAADHGGAEVDTADGVTLTACD